MSATVILVHSAGHGAWCRERVVPELAARGIDTVAVDLPGRGARTEDWPASHSPNLSRRALVVDLLERLAARPE